MAAATRLGYQTNLAARALASRRSALIGVVLDTLADPLIAGVVEALECALCAQGYAIVFVTSGRSPERSRIATRTLVGRGVEALVFAGVVPRPEAVDLLGAQGLPWLNLSDASGADPLVIDTGRWRGGALAGRYLLGLGHRRFGVVAGSGAATRNGVTAALAEGEAALVADEPGADNENPDAARSAMRSLLDRGERPTAVVCGTDAEALAALRECSTWGIAVPDDISIVGFGDVDFARHTVPGLTTVRVSAAAVGARGAEMLLTTLAGGTPAPFEAPVKLVVRETAGPARD